MLTVHKAQVGQKSFPRYVSSVAAITLPARSVIPMTRKSSALFWTSTKWAWCQRGMPYP